MVIFLILAPPPGNPVLNISTVNNFSSVMRIQFESPLLTTL
jgi:hypothetical protein